MQCTNDFSSQCKRAWPLHSFLVGDHHLAGKKLQYDLNDLNFGLWHGLICTYLYLYSYILIKKHETTCNIAWHIAMIFLGPCLILIDHGHFQYNCISMGLTVGAIAAILSGKDLVGSILFSLALNHKQTIITC